MYDVMVLRPGGAWTPDTTGSLHTVTRRAHQLRTTNRGRPRFRIYDHQGRRVHI